MPTLSRNLQKQYLTLHSPKHVTHSSSQSDFQLYNLTNQPHPKSRQHSYPPPI